jgi:integrase
MGVKVREISPGVWGLRIDHKGHRKTVSIGSKSAANKAKLQAEIKLAEDKLGLLDAPATPTFGKVAKDWLEFVASSRSRGTLSRYTGIVNVKLKGLSSMPIDKITRGDVRDLLIKHYKAGASKASIGLIHTVASGVFGHALDDELITVVPTVRLLRKLDMIKDNKEITPFSAEEFEAVLNVVAYREFFEAAFQTGCRVGELCALEWNDVNFINKTIYICKTAKDQHITQNTKTHVNRTIDMSDRLLSILTGLKKADKELCFKLGIQQKHIFHEKGMLLSQNTLRRKLTMACKKVGIPSRTVHDVRHTTASILLSRGVPLVYVSKMLGHSSPNITLSQYTHYMPSENRGSINALDGSKSIVYKDVGNGDTNCV